jgi:hypothetical protein
MLISLILSKILMLLFFFVAVGIFCRSSISMHVRAQLKCETGLIEKNCKGRIEWCAWFSVARATTCVNGSAFSQKNFREKKNSIRLFFFSSEREQEKTKKNAYVDRDRRAVCVGERGDKQQLFLTYLIRCHCTLLLFFSFFFFFVMNCAIFFFNNRKSRTSTRFATRTGHARPRSTWRTRCTWCTWHTRSRSTWTRPRRSFASVANAATVAVAADTRFCVAVAAAKCCSFCFAASWRCRCCPQKAVDAAAASACIAQKSSRFVIAFVAAWRGRCCVACCCC